MSDLINNPARSYLATLNIKPEYWSVSSYSPYAVEPAINDLLAHVAALTSRVGKAEARAKKLQAKLADQEVEMLRLIQENTTRII